MFEPEMTASASPHNADPAAAIASTPGAFGKASTTHVEKGEPQVIMHRPMAFASEM
jgi:hypothetical protein